MYHNRACGVSIHAPRAGRDTQTRARSRHSSCFNPRAPCGARLRKRDDFLLIHLVSIHAPRAGRDLYGRYCICSFAVSIHAPRAGRDTAPPLLFSSQTVSIHAPRAGRDFGFTRPHRAKNCFNPRAPCGARRIPSCGSPRVSRFNPRAPCGARRCLRRFSSTMAEFQSTRPVRGATRANLAEIHKVIVSIHAPRAGRDCQGVRCSLRHAVSIHAPRAGRDAIPEWVYKLINVSIHAPRAGRDPDAVSTDGVSGFQSTRPVRGATCSSCG